MIASSTLASVLVLLVCGCFIVAVVVAFQRRQVLFSDMYYSLHTHNVAYRQHKKAKVKQLNISKPTLYKSQPQCTKFLQVHGDQSETLKETEIMDTYDEACSDIDIITGEIYY